MTVSADRVTADLRIKFDRKPESRDELELINQLKGYDFSWKGYGDAAKWHGPKASVVSTRFTRADHAKHGKNTGAQEEMHASGHIATHSTLTSYVR